MGSDKCYNIELAKQAGLAVDRYPCTDEELARAEDILEQELRKLSLDEREKLIFDIHGISTTTNEDPESIAKALSELKNTISKIQPKKAYDHALFVNAAFVEDSDFNTLFLRARQFNVKAAAEMIVGHFEIKKTLFGESVLGREIVQSDLSCEDLEVLRKGFCQILPESDASGRAVVAIDCECVGLLNAESMARTVFYSMSALLRNKDAREKGVVYVIQNMQTRLFTFGHCQLVNKVDAIIPLITAAGHYCGERNLASRSLFTGLRLFEKLDRFRYTSHFGTFEEVAFELQTYGIPTHLLPLQKDGTRSTTNHLQWLDANRNHEELTVEEASTLIVLPRRLDVLFGKSQKAKSSPGTLRALNLVDSHQDLYESKSKHEKTEVANKIIRMIHESGGRFLKLNKEMGGWEEVDEICARQKVAHWFRHLRSKTRTTNLSVERDESESSFSESSTGSRVRAQVMDEERSQQNEVRPTKKRSFLTDGDIGNSAGNSISVFDAPAYGAGPVSAL